MQRSLFISGLSGEEPDSALGQVLLWDGMTVGTELQRALLGHLRQSSWAQWRQGHLQAALDALRVHLQEAPEKEAPWTREFANPLDRQAMKLCRLLDYHRIPIAAVPDIGTLHVAGLEIEARAIEAVRSAQRQRDASGNPTPEVKQIEDLVPHVLRRLFTNLDNSLATASPQERERVAEQIAEDLDRLDAGVREEVRRVARLSDLSKETLVKVGRLGTLGAGLAAVTSVGGFAAYAMLSSTIATLSGLVGLTLPFSVYVLAMSLLACVSNPLVVLAAIGGGGACWMTLANRKMRAELFPVLVAFAVLKSMSIAEAEARDRVSRLVEHLANLYQGFVDSDRARRAHLLQAFPAFRYPWEYQRAS